MATVNFDTADTLDITARRGDTFSMTINLKDSAGTALTLTADNYEFIMEVRSGSILNRGGAVISTTNSGSVSKLIFEPTVVDDSGNVTISASALTMRDILPGTYVYDIQYIKPNSSGLDDHRTIIKGDFTINQDLSVPA
jgi:hypothetical protein